MSTSLWSGVWFSVGTWPSRCCGFARRMCGLSMEHNGLFGAFRKLLYNAVVSKRLLGYVRSFQTACGVSAQGFPSNPVLHVLFSLASTFGDEAFYTVALPLCSWVLDLGLTRRLVFFWASTYYVGQASKDWLRLPRPTAPAVRLEHQYSAEYGLPSTHTMGSLIPLFMVASHCWNSDGSIPLGWLFSCVAWSAAIASSRLYMGVHSIPDIAAGYLLGGLLMVLWLVLGNTVDAFIVENSWAWLVVAIGAGIAILAYPRPERWTNSYGDTALIVATAAGFLEGCCIAQGQRGENSITVAVLEGVHVISSGRFQVYGWNSLCGDARRCLVGFMVLLPIRFVLKYACRSIMSQMLERSPRWPETEVGRRHAVDIPSKTVVYGCMGFSARYFVPLLWLRLGLQVDGRCIQ